MSDELTCKGDCVSCEEPEKELCAIFQSQRRTFEIKHLISESVIPMFLRLEKLIVGQNELIQNLSVENSKLKSKKDVPTKVDKTNKRK